MSIVDNDIDDTISHPNHLTNGCEQNEFNFVCVCVCVQRQTFMISKKKKEEEMGMQLKTGNDTICIY